VPLLEPVLILAPVTPTSVSVERPAQFATVCKLFLKKSFNEHEQTLLQWHEEHLQGLGEDSFQAFIGELARSAKGTPRGRQRRSAGATNEDAAKLLLFLENLLQKYTHT